MKGLGGIFDERLNIDRQLMIERENSRVLVYAKTELYSIISMGTYFISLYRLCSPLDSLVKSTPSKTLLYLLLLVGEVKCNFV